MPEKLKGKLRKPFGRVYTSLDAVRELIKGRRIIAVGDVISYMLISAGIIPDIIVFDKKERRRKIMSEIEELLEGLDVPKLSVKNPRGNITPELWNTVKEALKFEKSVKIFVSGEEDLAVIPFIIECDEGTLILYGLVDEGFVLVEVNKDIKKKCKELLSEFKRAGSSAW